MQMTEIKPTLYVCINCPNERQAGPCEGYSHEEGQLLHQHLRKAVAAHPTLATQAVVAPVKCMGGCETPCSVAFTAAGKETLLFTETKRGMEEDILTCFARYVAMPGGARLMKADRPASMKDNLLVRVPEPVEE